mmetsp:Transcript_48357/g.93365  ORF Transcript_48357/g.93365 Transcript_48357/m.93365 type:complete len:109 (-) Transcript_48357:62-388(-)
MALTRLAQTASLRCGEWAASCIIAGRMSSPQPMKSCLMAAEVLLVVFRTGSSQGTLSKRLTCLRMPSCPLQAHAEEGPVPRLPPAKHQLVAAVGLCRLLPEQSRLVAA